MSNFNKAYRDNEERLAELHEADVLREDDFYCIEANENVMRLNHNKALETIATQAAVLEAQSDELAKARQFIRDVAETVVEPTENRLRKRHELDALLLAAHVETAQEMVTSWDEKQAPETPVSPAPKFKVGDKVRIVGLDEYPEGAFDTIENAEMNYGTLCYGLRFWDNMPTDKFLPAWKDSELIPYTEENVILEISKETLANMPQLVELCAVPVLQKVLLAKNEPMALISMGDDTLVMFPRAWHMYRHAIEQAIDFGTEINVRAKADYSKGELQYIFEEML